jgi:hypothetical protein
MGHTFLNRTHRVVSNTAKVVGALHTAYQIGKGVYGLAQTAAPYVAAAAALL